MRKLSYLFALVLSGLIFCACMKDSPTEPPKGVISVKNLYANDGFAIGDTIRGTAHAVVTDFKKTELYFDGSLRKTCDSAVCNIEIPTAGLSAGVHQVKVLAYGSEGSLETAVPIYLSENLPPGITITSPLANSSYKIGSAVNFTANASDDDGIVTAVSFYINDSLINTDSSSPFTSNWNTAGLAEGVYKLKATARDNLGVNKSSEVETSLYLSIPPVVVITSPVNNSLITQGVSTTVMANATDTDGTIEVVRFYVDGDFKTSDTTTPYNYDWNTSGLEAGSQHLIKVVAKDDTGKEGEKSVSVSIRANTPPSLDVTGLTDGSYIVLGSTCSIIASAADADGAISEVCFYIDNVLKNTDLVSPYNYDWSTAGLTLGSSHLIKVTARDNSGAETTKNISVTITAPTLAGMVYVDGGTFQMGDATYTDSSPIHTVTLSGFYIGKYEVTQALWIETIGSNPSSFPNSLQNPVERVSWYDILVYCNWRSIAENLTPCYTINGSTTPLAWGAVPTSTNTTWDAVICNWSANGYRLPTEAEWEYAARGGRKSHSYTYSGSNYLDEVAWFNNNGTFGPPQIVGKKAANELGIYDMSGNVGEWNWDRYSYSYSAGAQTNPHGVSSGGYRVWRGGCASDHEEACKVGRRTYKMPYDDGYGAIGFRLVRLP